MSSSGRAKVAKYDEVFEVNCNRQNLQSELQNEGGSTSSSMTVETKSSLPSAQTSPRIRDFVKYVGIETNKYNDLVYAVFKAFNSDRQSYRSMTNFKERFPLFLEELGLFVDVY